jgi:Skp family chaperone for outer membrane proteins
MFMKTSRWFQTTSLTLLVVAVVVGCSKKEATTPNTAVNTTADVPATAATAAAAPTAAAVADAQRMFAEADAALKAREYQKAVEAMLKAQQQRLTDQQSAQSRNRMIELQSALAGAAAGGDPNAKAAIQRLRESATYR